jgi:type IV secretory pathway protease TraF
MRIKVNNDMLKKLCFFVLIPIIALMSLAIIFSNRIIYNATPSMPRGLYVICKQEPRVWDYVIFRVNDLPPLWQERFSLRSNYRRLLKQIISQNDNESFVLGHHESSFDSRFYGALLTHNLTRVRLVLPF